MKAITSYTLHWSPRKDWCRRLDGKRHTPNCSAWASRRTSDMGVQMRTPATTTGPVGAMVAQLPPKLESKRLGVRSAHGS